MSIDTQRLYELTEAYLADTITAVEGAELAAMLKQPAYETAFKELISGQLHRKELNMEMPSQAVFERIKAGIDQQLASAGRNHPVTNIAPAARRIHSLRKWWWAAASVVLLVSAGIYLWILSAPKMQEAATVPSISNDVLPGKNGAILTLADGRQVVLDSMGNGIIAIQNGSEVNLKNGRLSYDPGRETSAMVVYNTMTTPRGRQFQVTLPDGTKVWLNAASSITYPTIFNGKDRSVKITGEVYFEVAKDKRKPFMVNINDKATVEVTGTNFNINAYADEVAIRTTLLEGSVKISKGIAMETLQPNQQAVVGEGIQKLPQVNTDQVMAWKNGVFNFNGLGLAALMRQLSRWYDVEVVYTAGVPDVELYGKVGRDLNLSQVLEGLQEMDVRCRLEGKKLIVE